MNLYDNIAFPLREHTKKSESEIKEIVLEKMDMVGLLGAEGKLPGEISGGMRKRAGLARALVLDPEIILFDEPDSGLDPVRAAYLNQLIVDLNAEIDATFLIVTHDINTARTVPDNIGLLFRRNLVMFGPREMLLTRRSRSSASSSTAGGRARSAWRGEGRVAQVEAEGSRGPPLPPIPPSCGTSEGRAPADPAQPGAWCRSTGSTPPPGSFESTGTALATAAGRGRGRSRPLRPTTTPPAAGAATGARPTARPTRRSARGRPATRGEPRRRQVATRESTDVSNPASAPCGRAATCSRSSSTSCGRCPSGRSRPGSSSSRPGSSPA